MVHMIASANLMMSAASQRKRPETTYRNKGGLNLGRAELINSAYSKQGQTRRGTTYSEVNIDAEDDVLFGRKSGRSYRIIRFEGYDK